MSDFKFSSAKKNKLLNSLRQLYGVPKTELEYRNPFELLISVMLSAQSTDRKVNQVTKELFKKYKNAKALSQAKIEDVELVIKEVNYYITKSKHLIETSKILVEKFNSIVPKTHAELISLPGVGNKTANVVMSELGYGYAFPVDTHVFRVSKRIGLAVSDDRNKVESELCKHFDKNDWHDLHHWLIFHGRRICIARKPKCSECDISALCCHFLNNQP